MSECSIGQNLQNSVYEVRVTSTLPLSLLKHLQKKTWKTAQEKRSSAGINAKGLLH